MKNILFTIKFLSCSLFVVIIFMLSACNNNFFEESSIDNSPVSNNEDKTSYINNKSLYPEGLPNEGKTIKIVDAEMLVYKKAGNNDTKNIFACEDIIFVNNRVYYCIRGFNSNEIKETTFGWYAVDVFDGRVYDTVGLTDLVLI